MLYGNIRTEMAEHGIYFLTSVLTREVFRSLATSVFGHWWGKKWMYPLSHCRCLINTLVLNNLCEYSHCHMLL